MTPRIPEREESKFLEVAPCLWHRSLLLQLVLLRRASLFLGWAVAPCPLRNTGGDKKRLQTIAVADNEQICSMRSMDDWPGSKRSFMFAQVLMTISPIYDVSGSRLSLLYVCELPKKP